MELPEGARRQFFRLVAGKIDTWFAAHSTPNPLGVEPDAAVVATDKFTGAPTPVPAQASSVVEAFKSQIPAPQSEKTTETAMPDFEQLQLS